MSVDRLTNLFGVAKAAVPLSCLTLIPGNVGNGTLGWVPATRLQIKLVPSVGQLIFLVKRTFLSQKLSLIFIYSFLPCMV